MTFLKDLGKGISVVGEAFVPVKKFEGIVKTAHDDVKGITKGTYKIASGISKDVGTSLTQLTSPIGLISIAAILGAVILISRK